MTDGVKIFILEGMHLWPMVALTTAIVTQSPTPTPAPSKTTSAGLVNLRAVAFESELLNAVNAFRQSQHQEAVPMNELYRMFARHQADDGANGVGTVAGAQALIQKQHLAPAGYRLYFSAAPTAAEVLADLQAHAPQTLQDDFVSAGIGAFYVPAEPPYFQVVLFFVKDSDTTRENKPGLSVAQTDAVMLSAAPDLANCYNKILRSSPNLRGDCMLKLVIGPGGKVTEAAVERSLKSAPLDACLLSVARALQFPAPYKNKPVSLTHPLRLTPPQGNKQIGILSNQQIQAVFTSKAGEFRGCYKARLKITPGLAGTITVTGVVNAKGAFQSMDILQNDTGDAELAQCVLLHARRVIFPPPKGSGEAQLTYPLHFGL